MRYVAVRPIHIGGALAFAAGAPVPEGHVERFRLLEQGVDGVGVVEVDDDSVGSRPDLVTGLPDTTPATVSIGERLLYGDLATGGVVKRDTSRITDGEDPPALVAPNATNTKEKPAAGATTSTKTEG